MKLEHPHRVAYQKPRNTKKTFVRLFSYLKHYKLQTAIALITILISAFSGVFSSYLLKPAINNYIIPFTGLDSPELSGFIKILVLIGAIYLIGAVSTLIYSRILVSVSTDVVYKLRLDLAEHLQTLPLNYFDQTPHGEIMSRFSTDTTPLRQLLSQTVPHLVSALATITGVFVIMCILSPVLMGVVVIMVALMSVAIKLLGSQSANYFKQQQNILGEVNGYIEEMVEGQNVVKVYCREDIVTEEFDRKCEELGKSSTIANTFGNVIMPVTLTLSYMQYALIAAIGGIMVIRGMTDIGTIVSFLQYTKTFSQPVTQFSQQTNSIFTALAGAERIFDLLDRPCESDDGDVSLVNIRRAADGTISESSDRTGLWAWKVPETDDAPAQYVQVRGDVRFIDVTFSYENSEPALSDVSFYAKPGQRISIIGANGAGKTTITNLMNRFYDVSDGQILYDGININRIKKADLRSSFGMVLQDTNLFYGTVMENIRYGNPSATDEQVIAAAKLVSADSFISNLPDGYATVLTSDGLNLSHGQRQLISIARAAIKNAPVLILDEATDSIDTRTEAYLQKGMDKLMEGRTVFVIAHRLSSLRGSKAIIVMDHGKVIERGTHEDLLALRGRYYELYTGMSELE